MSKVNLNDIKGFFVDGEIICMDCAADPYEFTESEILTHAKLDENSLYFCDYCSEQI